MSEDNVDQPEDAIDAEIVELIEHDIDALVQERNEFKDIALRLQADFENYKSVLLRICPMKLIEQQGESQIRYCQFLTHVKLHLRTEQMVLNQFGLRSWRLL